MQRRELLWRSMSLLGLSIIFGPIACSTTEPEEEETTPTTITSISTYENGHSHTIQIERSLVENPPSNGRTFTSTGSHTHSVTLSSSDFQTLSNGSTLTKTSSSSDGHTHGFNFKA